MKAIKIASNWKTLQKKISVESSKQKIIKTLSEDKDTKGGGKLSSYHVKLKKGISTEPLARNASNTDASASTSSKIIDEMKSNEILSMQEREKYVALDCEMVGLGPTGKQSALARCCVVNFDGEVLYDRFVRPKGFVTDFRTKYSGVRQSDLRKGEACLFEECQSDVAKIIKNKVLVGHAIMNDMDVLMLGHPRGQIRDTAHYRPLMRTIGHLHIKYRPRALRDLAKQHLNIKIQDGEHDPGVDARATMMLYRKFRSEWEKNIQNKKYGIEMVSTSKAASTSETKSTKKRTRTPRKDGKVATKSSMFDKVNDPINEESTNKRRKSA